MHGSALLSQSQVITTQHDDVNRFLPRQKCRAVATCFEPIDRTVQIVTKAAAPPFELVHTNRCGGRGDARKLTADASRWPHLLGGREADRAEAQRARLAAPARGKESRPRRRSHN